jgi:hypothetical protein
VKYLDTGIPRRKRKPKETPLEGYEPYQKLRLMVMNGKMKPFQEVGILLDQSDAKQLDMKWPWRTVADRLRRTVRELGQESEYQIVKYETDTPGVWFVKVRYEPPVTAAKGERVKNAPRVNAH